MKGGRTGKGKKDVKGRGKDAQKERKGSNNMEGKKRRKEKRRVGWK